MQYTTETPLDLDHVLTVIGKDRFMQHFHKPIADWGLTDNEIARLRVGPHGEIATYLVTRDLWGFDESVMVVECECGEKFEDRLLSSAMTAHDDHAGKAKHNWAITADMLEA